jgi:hypothetical protein
MGMFLKCDCREQKRPGRGSISPGLGRKGGYKGVWMCETTVKRKHSDEHMSSAIIHHLQLFTLFSVDFLKFFRNTLSVTL